MTSLTPGQLLVLVTASLGAGVMNSLAGGGTLLTFPALLLLGVPAVQANATSTIALLPGAAASMAAYRKEVWAHREWLNTLFVPSLLGGAAGSVLLLRTPDRTFARMAPFLILFATLLFLVQLVAGRWVERVEGVEGPHGGPPPIGRTVVSWLLQFGVAVYGGYFGAGIGILMLVILGFLGLSDIHAMNGLKNFFGICINSVAAAYFIARGAVNWPAAFVMMGAAAVGGYAGARFARHIGKEKARAAVVVIGFGIAVLLYIQR